MFKFVRSLFWQIVNTIVKLFLEIFIFNRRIRRIMKGNFAKFYLNKYVKKATKENLPKEQKIEEQIIWQYWEQGLDNAPDIVKACLDSVEKYRGDIKRIIINPDNIKDYVHIPEYIYKLKEKGIIKLAHFSDILRTYLLVEHGGIWIDATVLLTAPLPDYVTKSDLFVLKADEKADLDGLNMTSYFLASKKTNNKILTDTQKVLELYWKDNNFLVNYFMFLHAFTMVSLRNKDIWNKVPFYSFIPVQQLQSELVNKFDKTRWEQLKKITSIHKLTYKQKVMTKKKDINLEETFYEAIIKGKIYE